MSRRYSATIAAAGCFLACVGRALAAEEHGESTNIFNADIGNFIFTLIIFGLVVYLLGKFAWRPVLAVLQERERAIRDSLESARRERLEAEKLLADYQARLDRARQEADALIDQGRQDAEAVRDRMIADARTQTGEMTARARREIELATDTALKELYDRTADLSIAVASRIIGRELSAADHKRLITDAITEIRNHGAEKLN